MISFDIMQIQALHSGNPTPYGEKHRFVVIAMFDYDTIGKQQEHRGRIIETSGTMIQHVDSKCDNMRYPTTY